jgi:hypothetical protein
MAARGTPGDLHLERLDETNATADTPLLRPTTIVNSAMVIWLRGADPGSSGGGFGIGREVIS